MAGIITEKEYHQIVGSDVTFQVKSNTLHTVCCMLHTRHSYTILIHHTHTHRWDLSGRGARRRG
jgi:hypothetical protein